MIPVVIVFMWEKSVLPHLNACMSWCIQLVSSLASDAVKHMLKESIHRNIAFKGLFFFP